MLVRVVSVVALVILLLTTLFSLPIQTDDFCSDTPPPTRQERLDNFDRRIRWLEEAVQGDSDLKQLLEDTLQARDTLALQ